jgi:hypothetical protein
MRFSNEPHRTAHDIRDAPHRDAGDHLEFIESLSALR